MYIEHSSGGILRSGWMGMYPVTAGTTAAAPVKLGQSQNEQHGSQGDTLEDDEKALTELSCEF